MAILKVARMGHPILYRPTPEMSKGDILANDTQRLVDDMLETMHEYEGVGLAAPQVHHNKRLLVAEVKANPRYPDAPVIPQTVLFNFKLVSASSTIEEDWEGCLSMPGIRGLVPRANQIEVEAMDRNAKPMKFKATGFFARVLQHEGDHLDGIMFPERMEDMSTLTFLEEFTRYRLGNAD